MPLLGTVEFFKLSDAGGHQADSMTRDGYQPVMENPIMWDHFADLKNAIAEILDRELSINWEIHRSWFVSYNKGGWQDWHTHDNHNSLFSGVVCLIGSDNSGKLKFETGEEFYLTQGDVMLFDSTINHCAEQVTLPKTVLAFDVRQR